MTATIQANYPPALRPKGSDISETINGTANSFSAADFLDADGKNVADMVQLQVLGVDCHYTLDATTPTGAATEYVYYQGDRDIVSLQHLLAMTFIRPSGSTATGTIRATLLG